MNKRILVIDDEEHIRRMIRLTLESAGYEVGEAGDGVEGLKLFDDGSAWGAVVLDQRMPGIDGLETLRQIKQRDPDALVVMATAYASIELAVDSMKFGATDFVRKPMTPETLRNAVAAAIAKQPAVPPGRLSRPIIEEPSPAEIPTITMNGFTILDPEKGEWHLPEERHFTVVDPIGARHEVTVRIEEEAVSYVERMTRRSLPPESSFWTDQARRLLSDFLWYKGEVPRTKFMALTEISRELLTVAERWEEN
ncbi:MAG TPA: response regulator [Pyrinomonadaceae bacterium]|nr:response regulator [Pyrinomonadaceae bacterium]